MPGNSVNANLSLPSNFVPDNTSNVRQQGEFRARTVSLGTSSPFVERIANTNKPDHATPLIARTVAEGVGEGFAMGNISRFSTYLANNVERGRISRDLLPDFETAVTFANQVDKDILRASVLLDKSEHTPLTEAERTEVNTLMGSNQHNLALVQGWLSKKRVELQENGDASVETLTFMQNLQERLADRHMDVVDLMSLYDLDLTQGQEAVSRSDRIDSNLLNVTAALTVARNLSVPGLSDASKNQIVGVLEDQHRLLTQAKELAGDRSAARRLPQGDRLTLAAKEIWDTPFSLIKETATDADSIKQLRAQWDAKTRGEGGPWLPLVHPRIGQQALMREFLTHQLKAAGVSKNDMPDLKFQLHGAKTKALNDQPWETIHKDLHYTLDDHTYTVESRITPAKQLSAHFSEGYDSNGISHADRMQYKHAPNLAHTQLTNESNELLFSGLRHGVLDAYDITASNLNKLSDKQLDTMIGDLLVQEPPELKASILSTIRSDPAQAKTYAAQMRSAASKKMAEEVAVAALVSDPAKFQSALEGNTVNLNLSSISLLTPDRLRAKLRPSGNEREMLQRQTIALKALAQEQPLELTVRDNAGQLRTIKANINVRTFNFGVNGAAVGKMYHIPSTAPGWKQLMGWGYAMEKNDPDLTQLLGGTGAGLGGDVGDKLVEINREREQLRNDLREGRVTAENQTEVGRRVSALDKQYQNLHTAASDAKRIWQERSFIRGGEDPYKMVSRLALVGNLMDETPLFNCKSGKDRTGQLDAEVKYLAALAEHEKLPRPGSVGPDLRAMRSEFTLNAGNLEMQKLNSGLPGYKLPLREVPGLAQMIADQALESVYRGGSDYIKS